MNVSPPCAAQNSSDPLENDPFEGVLWCWDMDPLGLVASY